MTNVFQNEREGRPRAFWRLFLQFVLYLFGLTVLGNGVLLVLLLFSGVSISDPGAISRLASSPAFLALNGVVSLIVTVFSVWLVGRFLDRRPFSGFGVRLSREWWLDFGFGLLLGALLMTGIFVVELAAGWVTVTGTFTPAAGGGGFFPAILAPIVLFLCVGFYEELSSRGYQLTNIAEGLRFLGPRVAVLAAWAISSAIFGLLHALNPNATLLSTLNIALAGILLGIGYVLTGRLGIPVGLHITWNLFQGNVFGFPVSGLDPIGASVFAIQQGGPTLLTGGPFGPEAGLLGLAAMIVGSLLILLWVRARHGKVGIETSIAEPPPTVKQRMVSHAGDPS